MIIQQVPSGGHVLQALWRSRPEWFAFICIGAILVYPATLHAQVGKRTKLQGERMKSQPAADAPPPAQTSIGSLNLSQAQRRTWMSKPVEGLQRELPPGYSLYVIGSSSPQSLEVLGDMLKRQDEKTKVLEQSGQTLVVYAKKDTAAGLIERRERYLVDFMAPLNTREQAHATVEGLSRQTPRSTRCRMHVTTALVQNPAGATLPNAWRSSLRGSGRTFARQRTVARRSYHPSRSMLASTCSKPKLARMSSGAWLRQEGRWSREGAAPVSTSSGAGAGVEDPWRRRIPSGPGGDARSDVHQAQRHGREDRPA